MAIPEQQAEAAAFLQALTGSAPAETTISAVFVGPRDVYKLKKAVKLSFLDFSATETRGRLAQRELDLNRVAAPDIYRGVCAIIRDSHGGIALAGPDAACTIDYVVHMAPIAQGDFFEDIASRCALTPALLDGLGDYVAELHGRLKPIAGWDSAGGMRHIIDGNMLAGHAAGLDAATLCAWKQAACTALDHIVPVLAARAASGHVRRLHGDLHLGNLCLWDGKPTAFDMLEFDEALATGDVGYDLAFLLMDLECQAERASANRVMGRYIARTGDVGLLALLPLFSAVRALTRAHVEASRCRPAESARYLRMATQSLAPEPACLVAVGGLQGTGKTTLGRAIAPALGRAPGALLLRSDEIRKRLFGARPEQKLPQSAYTQGANARVNDTLLADIATALRCGQAVVADCTFLHAPLRHGVQNAARTARVPFQGFWLEAPLDILLRRVADRHGDASDAGPDIVRQAAASDPGHLTWQRVLAEDAGTALHAVRAELPVQERSAPDDAAGQIAFMPGSSDHGFHDG